jgi:DNA-binding response OmpR family regulator
MEQNARVLAVDDEPDLLDNIGLALETDGYDVLTAQDGRRAIEILRATDVDLIIADIAMPEMNGYQLLERVRQNPDWVAIPFVFLTARKLDSDIRYGKEMGVDDYLVKPIHSADLLAVVRGKLRRVQQLRQAAARASSEDQSTDLLTLGQLEIELDQHRVRMNGSEISLSAREFSLLQFMAQHAGELLHTQDLVLVTHGLETDSAEAGTLVRPLIRTLRRKLGYSIGDSGCIENVRGVGYRLVRPN